MAKESNIPKKEKHRSVKQKSSSNGSKGGEEQDDFESMEGPKKWFERFPFNNIAVKSVISDEQKTVLRREAGNIFNEAVSASKTKPPKSISKSDFKWMKKVIMKGTLNDRIAAYVLLIQDDPLANFSHISNMVSMIKVGKKRECFMTMDTLVQLFIEDLLPPDRKLRYFMQQPLGQIEKITSGNLEARRILLLGWFFEDKLKEIYSTFVSALNHAAHDSVEANKASVITVMSKLLMGHPEQEAALLSNIANKLGDPNHKIGSKVIYTLTKILDAHPAMRGVVMEEVERVIFRPNMGRRAQYYAICFLTQFTFEKEDGDLARSLIKIYFSLFKACIKLGDIDSRMMSALLTGVSRAFPYTKGECESLKDHIDTIYKVVHLSGTNVAIHALCLLHLIVGDDSKDRFMKVLYKKVGESSMYHATHHAMFLSLIFKSLKKDTDQTRVCAFIKRLYQVAVHLTVPLICGVLVVISQVIHSIKDFKLQLTQSPSEATLAVGDEDDEEEHYKDCSVDEIKVEDDVTVKTEPADATVGSSWYHAARKVKVKSEVSGQYDPYNRNPSFAAADKALPCELLQLTRHYHPTVSLFSENILKGIKIEYNGDPLQDFSLIRFLDKFVFKNPKKIDSDNTVATFSAFDRKKYYKSVGVRNISINSKQFVNLDEGSVPVDEMFMYKYMKQKAENEGDDRTEKDDDSDAESLDEEELKVMLKGMGGVPKDEDDMDFMREIGSLPKTSGGKKKGSTDVDDDDEEEEEDDDDEQEDDYDDDNDEEMEDDDDMFLDGSISGDDFDDADEDADDDILSDPLNEIDDESPQKKRKISDRFGGPKKKKGKMENFFVAAEEFSEMLEADSYKAGTLSALSNKDNADMKQLKWEVNRDKWLKPSKFNKRGKHTVGKSKRSPVKSTKKHFNTNPKKKRKS